MHVRPWLFAPLVGLAAVTSGPIIAAPKPQPVAKTPAPTWRWKGSDPTHQVPGVDVSQGDQRCRYSRDTAKRTSTLACFDKAGSKLWSHDLVQAHMDSAVLAMNNESVYVVRFSDVSSGATVTSFSRKQGTVNWHRQVLGLGPIDHSEYLTNVEAGVVDGVLRVYGWESAGRYIEDFELQSGAVLATGSVDDYDNFHPRVVPKQPSVETKPLQPGAAKGVAFVFAGNSPRWNKTVSASAKGTSCVETFTQNDDSAVLTCTTKSAGKTASSKTWGLKQSRFVPGGALAINDRLVVVATFCAISTGATLDAYARETGELLWHTELYAVGPVGHSKYFNDVELRFEGGKVVVSGAEAYGKYVEVVDAATGRVLGNRSEGKIEAEY